jgi:hypothetical protein
MATPREEEEALMAQVIQRVWRSGPRKVKRVCPAGLRCVVKDAPLGWGVLVEHDVTIAPLTGSLALVGGDDPVSVPAAAARRRTRGARRTRA